MIRIVGILCGSALAVSFLIVVLGVPEIFPDHEETAEIVIEQIADPQPLPDVAQIAEAAEIANVAQITEVAADDRIIINEAVVEPMPDALTQVQPTTEHWYAFWSPFRSELAANGFVSQLQRTTGMDYRVVRLKPGVYEVAFSYVNDGDIAAKLAVISTATGLEMHGG